MHTNSVASHRHVFTLPCLLQRREHLQQLLVKVGRRRDDAAVEAVEVAAQREVERRAGRVRDDAARLLEHHNARRVVPDLLPAGAGQALNVRAKGAWRTRSARGSVASPTACARCSSAGKLPEDVISTNNSASARALPTARLGRRTSSTAAAAAAAAQYGCAGAQLGLRRAKAACRAQTCSPHVGSAETCAHRRAQAGRICTGCPCAAAAAQSRGASRSFRRGSGPCASSQTTPRRWRL
jgi:hypothetical protein